MDNRLSDALAFANYRLTLQIQRQNIAARVEVALTFSYQNAIFKASISTISFVDVKVRANTDLYIEDQSANVIKIEDPGAFLAALINVYDSAMQLKLEEQQKLKFARTTAKIVGL